MWGRRAFYNARARSVSPPSSPKPSPAPSPPGSSGRELPDRVWRRRASPRRGRDASLAPWTSQIAWPGPRRGRGSARHAGFSSPEGRSSEGQLEDGARRLIGAGLFGGDHPVEGHLQVLRRLGEQVVIGIRDDAEAVLALERAQGWHGIGKRGPVLQRCRQTAGLIGGDGKAVMLAESPHDFFEHRRYG